MILDRAQRIRATAVTLRERTMQQDREVAWTTHAESLADLAAKIERPRAFLRWLNDQGTSFALPSLTKANTAVKRLLQGLTSDPERILKRTTIGEAKSACGDAAEVVEEAACDAWKMHVAKLPTPDAELYAAFRDDARFAQVVRRADEQDRKYEELRRVRYLDTTALRVSFSALLVEREQTRAQLPEITDEEVRAFVVAAARDGATLDSLTDNVRAWLEQHGLAHSYAIRKIAAGQSRPRGRR